MSFGTESIQIKPGLSIDKRKGSNNWQARISLGDGKRQVKSTGTQDRKAAEDAALGFYYEVKANLKNKLPPSTRKFRHVANFAIKRMEEEIESGGGKQAYKDYISALHKWHIPFLGNTDITKVDLKMLKEMDIWREQEMGRKPAQSTLNNHNAALNRVFDEAELQRWMNKSLRPTLLNKGTRSESRGAFTPDEYKKIYEALRTWHKKTEDKEAKANREVLRNYVLCLANTGIRPGKEAINIKWRNVVWHVVDDKQYVAIHITQSKTTSRTIVAKDGTDKYLFRQAEFNPRLKYDSFDKLIAAQSDEYVFTRKDGKVAKPVNLSRSFSALLTSLNMKIGSDGKIRTIYSLRHYYATQDLKRGMSTHSLSKQLGNSTKMIDTFYSKLSPLLNAEQHSERFSVPQTHLKNSVPPSLVNIQKSSTKTKTVAELAFEALEEGKITEDQLMILIGVNENDFKFTDEIKYLALEAINSEKLSKDAFAKLFP